MIEGEIVPVENLKDITKDFLDNNGDGSCNYYKGNKENEAS
jgi:hypothetical protein